MCLSIAILKGNQAHILISLSSIVGASYKLEHWSCSLSAQSHRGLWPWCVPCAAARNKELCVRKMLILHRAATPDELLHTVGVGKRLHIPV